MSAAAALERLGKRDHFDAALRVFEREDGHPIALARLQLAARRRRCRRRSCRARSAWARPGPTRRRAARWSAPRPARRSTARRIPSGRRDSDRPDGRSNTARAFPSRTRAARSRSTGPPRAGQSPPAARLRPSSSCPPNSCAWPFVPVALQPRAVLARDVDGRDQPRPRRRAGCPVTPPASESSAPAFARLSNTRLLNSRRSRSSQSACSDVIGPACAPDREQRLDRALADVLDRRQPEAHALPGSTVNAQLAFVDVRRQHRDAALAALAESTARACRCSAPRSSAAPRRSATGSSPSDTRSDTRETRTPSSATC